ncbi:MAG: restriction endonuclease [Nitrospirota bacterium]|nr:restriction endonuclease [Nitrospirota bacterium]
MATKIIKSSGINEDFDINKLINSLVRSGASSEVANEIAKDIERELPPKARTKDIFRQARRLLRKHNMASGMRYSIKKAIFALGPSGYPFEQYIGKVMAHHGYMVETNRIIKGYCVDHEVDVVASNNNAYSVIECKYHNNAGKVSDVKIALYVHARFQDIKKAADMSPEKQMAFHNGWLVTNTRCSIDAIRYAECVGLKIVSWKYPEKNSLERMIEDKRLYPVTILHSVRKNMLDTLFKADIILAQDIADMNEEAFVQKSGLDKEIVKILKHEADELCPCSNP